MPSKTSQETVADKQSPNAATGADRQDASRPPGPGADTHDKMSKGASTQKDANRNASTVQTVTTNQSSDLSESVPKGGKQSQAQDSSLVQIPDGGNTTKRQVESSNWHWETPLESIGKSSSYLYEPQGELLQEQREQRQTRAEFSIPHVLAGSSVNWQALGGIGSNCNEGFTVPKRHSGVPTPTAGVKRKSLSDQEASSAGRQPPEKRPSRAMYDGTAEPESPVDGKPPALSTRSQTVGPAPLTRSGTDTTESRPRPSITDIDPPRMQAPSSGLRQKTTDPASPMVLPARKVFPIQIGDKLFRLSGASISSDAPSYFSQFFEEQLRQNEGADSVRTLYIDRDPATFEDISLHLQGYHIEPRDGPHFVKLFADAQFFSLPRLTSQLFSSTIYIRIGDEEFQIPRDLFSNPGDAPNYFSLGFAMFFTTPTDVFPGLTQRTLLRPPSILPPSVPNRSARAFADLLHILKGYTVEIRSEVHRQELLRDARYFHLKGLEQRLIPHQISYNLTRKVTEILVRLEDIRQSGVSLVADNAGSTSETASPTSSMVSSPPKGPGWVYYQRPYVDSEAYCLIVEINEEDTTLLLSAAGSPSSPTRVGQAVFHRQTLSRVTSLFSVIANKMNLPISQPLGLMMTERDAGVASLPVTLENNGVNEQRVKVRIGTDADITVDGLQWLVGEDYEDDEDMNIDPTKSSKPAKKRKRGGGEDDEGEDWIVRKAQWRVRVQPVSSGTLGGRSGFEVILGAVKIQAFRSERGRNAARGFLV